MLREAGRRLPPSPAQPGSMLLGGAACLSGRHSAGRQVCSPEHLPDTASRHHVDGLYRLCGDHLRLGNRQTLYVRAPRLRGEQVVEHLLARRSVQPSISRQSAPSLANRPSHPAATVKWTHLERGRWSQAGAERVPTGARGGLGRIRHGCAVFSSIYLQPSRSGQNGCEFFVNFLCGVFMAFNLDFTTMMPHYFHARVPSE